MKAKRLVIAGILLVVTALVGVSTVVSAQSERVTVFRDLVFGDNQIEARQKVLQDDFFSVAMVNRGESALSPRGEVDLQIGENRLDLIFFFNQAGLYRLDASGELLGEDQFEEIRENHMSQMKDLLSERYGSPSFTQRHEPGDFDRGEFRTFVYWSSEHLELPKEIWLGISRDGDQFQLTLIIQDPKRADKPEYSVPDRSGPSVTVKQASEFF